MFKKYQHVERLGTDEVEGILGGKVYVFTKLDGTNFGCRLENGDVKVNSRNREISIGDDNHGCCACILGDERFKKYLEKHPNHYIYGEYLVKNVIKTYEDSAWKKPYVFDIVEYDENGMGRYLSYEEYVPLLEEFGIEYIPVIKIFDHPTEEEVRALQDECLFLQKEGCIGEGCIIKNFQYKNKYGHVIWAKVVRPQMKISKQTGRKVEQDSIESAIVSDLCTPEFVEKEYAKFVEVEGWNSKMIPKFLGCVWHTFVVEECWNMLRRYKNPKIDFKVLQKLVTEKIKEVKKELF